MSFKETAYTLLFQNDSLLVVDKAPGVSIHNAEGGQFLTQILEKDLRISKLFPIHRLDKETSGVQIYAKTQSTAKQLAKEFQDRSVQKIYHGVTRGPLSPSEGQWHWPLTDRAEGRKNPQGLSKERVPCATLYKVLETSKYFSFCEFELITGRQHQIRKHCVLAKHHLVGDSRYGDPSYNQKIFEIYNTNRMFLHCSSVKIANHLFSCPVPFVFKKLLNPMIK